MKKVFLSLLLVVVATVVTAYLLRAPIKKYLYDHVTADMFVPADTDDFDPGPAVGSSFPGMRALYQGQEIKLLSRFAGENGTVLVASRSVDWCPFCMKQMIQLNAYKAAFDTAGIGLVGITYDSPELQQGFIDKFDIAIPLLSDIDVLTFKTLGIVNQDYQSGDEHYGIPYPGMIIVNPAGLVAGKLFLEGYSTRVDSKAALAYAREVLGIPPEPMSTDH